jgi:hypothetical protein
MSTSLRLYIAARSHDATKRLKEELERRDHFLYPSVDIGRHIWCKSDAKRAATVTDLYDVFTAKDDLICVEGVTVPGGKHVEMAFAP